MQVLGFSGKGNFLRIPWFSRNQPELYYLGPNVIWLCCYMRWNWNYLVWHDWAIALRAVISNVFSCIFTKSRSKSSNFAMEPVLRLLTSQRHYYIFWKVCNRLKLNLCTCSFFSLEKGFLFKVILFVCSFYTRHFFLLAEPWLYR